MKRQSLKIVAACLVLTSQSALAAPEVVEEQVRLAFPADASAESIDRELRRTARRVCDSRAIYAHLQLSEQAECRKAFVRDAVMALDRPALTALHRAETPGDDPVLASAPPDTPSSK